MKRPYKTQPGTLQHRAVEYFLRQPEGHTLSTAELAEALDAEVTNMATALELPVRAELLARSRIDGRGTTFFWRLGLEGLRLKREHTGEPAPARPVRKVLGEEDGLGPMPVQQLDGLANEAALRAPIEGGELQMMLIGGGGLVLTRDFQRFRLSNLETEELARFIAHRAGVRL